MCLFSVLRASPECQPDSIISISIPASGMVSAVNSSNRAFTVLADAPRLTNPRHTSSNFARSRADSGAGTQDVADGAKTYFAPAPNLFAIARIRSISSSSSRACSAIMSLVTVRVFRLGRPFLITFLRVYLQGSAGRKTHPNPPDAMGAPPLFGIV